MTFRPPQSSAHTLTTDTCARPLEVRISKLGLSFEPPFIITLRINRPIFYLSSCLLLFPLRPLHPSYSHQIYHLQVCHLANVNCCTHTGICGELGSPCVFDSHSYCPTLVPFYPPWLVSLVSALVASAYAAMAFRPASYLRHCLSLSHPIILPFPHPHYTFVVAS